MFFFNDTATTEIYTLSLHDALPIYEQPQLGERPVSHEDGGTDAPGRVDRGVGHWDADEMDQRQDEADRDRKSTRLNSSHANISYAVFCLKKKTQPRPLCHNHHQSPT